MELIVIILFLVITYVTGTMIEKAHYRHVLRREKELLGLPMVTFEREDVLSKDKKVKEVRLISAYVVIGADYFKVFVASIKAFFGGRLVTYESIMDRARREAVLRLKEQAKDCDIILNLRLESANLNLVADKKQAGMPKAAIIAYGTAVTYE